MYWRALRTFDGRVMETGGEPCWVDSDHEGAAAVEQLEVRGALHPVPVTRKPQSHLELRLGGTNPKEHNKTPTAAATIDIGKQARS